MIRWEVWMWDYIRKNHQWFFLWASCCHVLVEETCLDAFCERVSSLFAPILDELFFVLKCPDIVWHWPKRTSQLWQMRQFSLVLNNLSPYSHTTHCSLLTVQCSHFCPHYSHYSALLILLTTLLTTLLDGWTKTSSQFKPNCSIILPL